MPKFVDKMNLPQYRYFHDMTVREEERQDIVSDFFTAQHQLNNGDQRGYRDGLILLGRVRSRLPDFLYAQEEDRKKCWMDMEAKNIRVQIKRMEKYMDLLLNLQFFQGLPLKREKFIEKKDVEGIPKEKLRRNQRSVEEEREISVFLLREIQIHDVLRALPRILEHSDPDHARVPGIQAVPPLSRRIVDHLLPVAHNRIDHIREQRRL